MEPSRNSQRSVAARRRAAARRKAARRRAMLQLSCGVLILLLTALLGVLLLFKPPRPVLEQVTLEAGHQPELSMFLSDVEKYEALAAFKTDLTTVDPKVPGRYVVELTVKNKTYTAELEVRDRTAPTAQAVETITEVDNLPQADALVTDIRDVSAVTVEYAKKPDVSQGGTVTAQVRLTDAYGNSAIVEVPLQVIADEIPPVIDGARDLEFFVGDPISYKNGITVTDDKAESPKLTVDNSQVDPNTAGTYPVVYTATDDAGNETTVTVNLTLKNKPKDYVDPETVYDLARKVLKDITNENMSTMEVAFAIYRWTSTKISYTGSSDKSSWTKGAYQAFTKRSGDCFNYFAAAKALFDVAGIDNVDVVKSDTSHSSHYWSLINLGDGWYHVDCTPRRNRGYFFMNTDAELEAYSVKNKNSHIFDTSAYPERATKSVQDKINYSTGKVTP